ncbi:hypothetical protein J2I47_04960 [Fibrella sp. HMF5335]|uniref:Lipocalin-like domain-containing protein n=1 Tax=Fibrella rubiginis TaxID=2817060 RepID=A0A939K480_9BACT|nr:hypothetical protein [Fibrella rubiginis]MBO0935891.1 hypothetical protein [Fibrella rubiginis]
MNRLFTFLLPILVGLLASLSACKKEQQDVDPNPNPPGGFVASFVGVRWQMASFELDPPQDLDGDGKPDSNLLQFLRPCDLDNTVVFERNGTMSGDNGKLKCDDDPATSKPGSWTYDNTTKKMKIVDGDDGTVSDWIVDEASARYLKVRTTITEDGRSYSAVITWKAV